MEQEYLGRYRIVGRLGKGGMGTVLRAVDEVRQREVAIKLPAEKDPQVIRRLQRECDVLGQLQHPHIVQVYGSGNDPAVPFYIVMEYVDGTTVEALLHQQPERRLEPIRALTIAQHVAGALAYAHQPPLRIIHRDIKPANVLIRASDEAVKVTDFGIAAVLAEHTSGKTAIGTMAYMAPEQATGRGVDERTDLYSLGAMLYEMLTGQRPPLMASAPPEPPSRRASLSLSPEMYSRIDRLVLSLLDHDPNQRPQRAQEVADELQAIIEGRPSVLSTGFQTKASPSFYGAPTHRAPAPAAPAYSAPTQRASRPPATPDYVVSSAPPGTPYVPPPPPPPPPVVPSRPAITPQSVVVQQPVAAAQPVYQLVQVVPATPPKSYTAFAGFSLAAGIIALLFALCPLLAIIVNLAMPQTKGSIDETTFWIFVAFNIPALLAVLLGHLAQLRIASSRGRIVGTGSATVGLCFGYFCIVLTVVAYFIHTS